MAHHQLSSNDVDSSVRLQMAGVKKKFGATHALRGVDLAVRPGDVHALIGENGAGKSTLMKVLSGAHPPDQGNMWLDGQLYRPRHPLDARRLGVAMIYQELSLAPHLSVMDNILLGVEPTKGPLIDFRSAHRQAKAALEQVGLGELNVTTPVHRLSLARQQLVEIARAVAVDCRVLVLDEPTSSLTQQDIQQLFGLIRRLRDGGKSIVYISHFLEEVQEISDHYTVLRDGKTVGHGVTSEARVHDLVATMVGREVHDLYPRSSRREDGTVVLDVVGLAGKSKPKSASFQLRRGRVTGIAGLIGSGRTELLRLLFGLDAVRAGEVRVGTFRGLASPQTRWTQGMGMVSEDRKQEGLALNLSIADNVTLSCLRNLGPWRLVLPSKQRQAAQPWIDKFHIKCNSAAQPVAALSGGNQQKVALARLLHANVDVLLLDEPTRGIDVGSKAQIYQWIDEWSAGDPATGRLPKAVLVVSSYLPELLGICDEICVMTRGRLGEMKPVSEWDEHQLMLAATGQSEPV